jgi:hypothetical protein
VRTVGADAGAVARATFNASSARQSAYTTAAAPTTPTPHPPRRTRQCAHRPRPRRTRTHRPPTTNTSNNKASIIVMMTSAAGIVGMILGSVHTYWALWWGVGVAEELRVAGEGAVHPGDDVGPWRLVIVM